MKYAFTHLRLQAPGLYALINTWAEMHLSVSPASAVITGRGYSYEIARAFTNLVFDWEASIRLPREELGLEAGEYELILIDGLLYACREQRKYAVADRPAVVEVERGGEEEVGNNRLS